MPEVEQVQDLVEERLIANGFAKTAKAYILYRAEHSKVRKTEADLVQIYRELTFVSAAEADRKRENANIDADTAMGTMLKYGSEGSNYFVDNYILPKDIAAAHINGDIHIHDKDFYMLTETCCQIDLIKLFKDGFSTGHGFVRSPKSIASYAALACIAIQANQNEMHGGQSIPNFDYAMADGVACTFRKEYYDALQRYFWLEYQCETALGDEFRTALKEALSENLDMANIDDYERPFINWMMSRGKDLLGIEVTEEAARRGHKTSVQIAMKETDMLTYQAMESLIHNLNTMNSRAGAQVPFQLYQLWNLHKDQKHGWRSATCSMPLIRVWEQGKRQSFRCRFFKVKDGINFQPGDPNYDLFRLAIKTSAKRLFFRISALLTRRLICNIIKKATITQKSDIWAAVPVSSATATIRKKK